MGKIYTGQSSVLLFVHTSSDLTLASVVELEGTKPDGTAFTPAALTTIDASEGLTRLSVTGTTFATAGTYTLWSHVEYSGGTESWGEPFHLNIYTPGS